MGLPTIMFIRTETDKRAAIHEVAHAAAAVVLGLPVRKVTIEDGSYLDRGHYTPAHDCGDECLSIMALAGSEGERLFFTGAGNSDDYYGDSIDLTMVRRYLRPRSELEFEVPTLGLLWIGSEVGPTNEPRQKRRFSASVAPMRHVAE
jgi:hypothetical protein